MGKLLKIQITCRNCETLAMALVSAKDVGKRKSCKCPKCHSKIGIMVPADWASKFAIDSTVIETQSEKSLLVETIRCDKTDYQNFPLTAEYYTIGRKNSSDPKERPDVEVVTEDLNMSRIHIAIRKRKSGFTVKDMESLNGTRLNGEKLEKEDEVYLEDGDKILIGRTELLVNVTEQGKGLIEE